MSKSNNNIPDIEFKSGLALWFQRFLQEKRAMGLHYVSEALLLRRLDHLLHIKGINGEELPQNIVELWLIPKSYHTPRTTAIYYTLIRQLAGFLIRNEIPAYLPAPKEGPIVRSGYVPWIFSHSDIRKLLAATDALPFCGNSPLYHRIMPEIFRLLYGCGLRVSEVNNLQVRDVDLDEGVLIIRETKGNNTRLVPVVPSMKERLNQYVQLLENRAAQAPFFPAPDGGFYSKGHIYSTFRKLLWQIGISHGGRGRGPRLHDIRHTMACHRLIKWYREGADLNTKLPILSAYLGHLHLSGTQTYLHLTAEMFPDLTQNLEQSAVNQVIPRRNTP
jgi:integrase